MTKYLLRNTALDILVRIDEGGGFSHLLIDQAIKKKGLNSRDEGLLTEIVYGTLQRKLTLEYFLSHFVDKKRKLAPWVNMLLYMSLYQMIYLDKVPDHAIIHESVEISKKRGHRGISGLVNGILRNVQRKGVPNVDKIEDSVKRLSIKTSHPTWLTKRWMNMYGMDITEAICETNLTHKPISVRIQPMKINKRDAVTQLEDEGFEIEESIFSDQGLVVNKGNILHSTLFKNGYLTIQDQSSMLVAEMMEVEKGMTVLDACSAPGGKTTHIAEKMLNEGNIHAYDLHDKKAKLVSKKALQLDLTIIEAKQADSRELNHYHKNDTFDRILIDAPCSGLGVLRGKPDIKYNKAESDIEKLASIQLELLEKISPLLKGDGKIIYSTCTIDKAENEKVVQQFLTNHPEYQIDEGFFDELPEALRNSIGVTEWGLQLFPHEFNTDGFFLTRITKQIETE
ncbi:16S rRNA (cytosine(967)-C(5))-methyltransferase RsmB [Aquibacillus albus]|uniref:16S rRNA (cytosine(967)-C(5))-methyltransferase n=1 Tax=Aquibacillus albus TaxID=1168171 RepID=A0ABS2N0V8_9BACI|nr:16S rRNA (cytosine(967)-C(5))-methyltransferase RsmB [Aquibacillus albus]MBM7571774.1 16S rRNA (cytosine967-C5)-methyltransferase [Aquibacillus albus]